MENDESPIGGPLELPGEESPVSHPINPSKPSRGWKKIVLVFIIIIIVGTLGFVAFKLLHKPKKTPTPSTASSTSNPNASSNPTVSDVPAVTSTKDLNNQSLGIALTYPSSWTPTETTEGIKIESPDFSYTTSDGTAVNGNFRFYIRKGARAVDSKYIGRGVAIAASQQLTYTSPLPTQRKTTNLSLFGLDTPEHFAFFLIAGNFNLKKGDTLGPNYGKEPETVLVTGGYSSKDLKDNFATNQVSLDKYNQTNAYKQALDIVKSLKLQ